MLSSPRSPSSTMRTFSAADYCRRVWRRMSFSSTCSAGAFIRPGFLFCFIFAPCVAATMNLKSSLREDPQFVSWVLTGNSSWSTPSISTQSENAATTIRITKMRVKEPRAVALTPKIWSIWRFEFAGKKIVVGIRRVAEPVRLLHRLNSFRPRRQVLSLSCGLGCLGVQILTRGPIRLLHGRASSHQNRSSPEGKKVPCPGTRAGRGAS